MSQPPPQRPWFRLASMVRPNLPPPPPPPVQQPTFRPPVIMPTVTPPPPPTSQPIPPRTSAPPSPLPTRTTAPPPPTSEPIPPRTSAPPSPLPTRTTAPPPTSEPIPPRTSAPPSPLPTRTTAPPPTSKPIPPRTSAPPSPLPTRTSTPPSPIPPTSAVVPSPPRHSTEPPSPLPPRANEMPSPPPPRPNALPSPANTPPHTILNYIIANQSPKSPAKNVDPTKTNSPNITPAQSPPHQASSTKPNSPIITKTLSSLPASPKFFSPKPSAPHPSPLPTYTSTPFQTVPSSPIATGSARTLRPWVETPPQSVKEKMLSHPPSPLTLPPAQIINPGNDHHMEAIPTQVEQKTVLLQDIEQKSKTTPKISNSKGHLLHNYHHEKKEQHKKDKGVNTQTKKHSHDHSEENVARVVTLAGENKGAIMELSPASRKQNGGGNKGSSKDHEKHKALGTETAAAMDAFINSNVQGVNNSVLYNCEFTHNDPGVHLSVSRKSNGNGRRGVHE